MALIALYAAFCMIEKTLNVDGYTRFNYFNKLATIFKMHYSVICLKCYMKYLILLLLILGISPAYCQIDSIQAVDTTSKSIKPVPKILTNNGLTEINLRLQNTGLRLKESSGLMVGGLSISILGGGLAGLGYALNSPALTIIGGAMGGIGLMVNIGGIVTLRKAGDSLMGKKKAAPTNK
jgi:hypothetical protein